jgi:hypothetical protein
LKKNIKGEKKMRFYSDNEIKLLDFEEFNKVEIDIPLITENKYGLHYYRFLDRYLTEQVEKIKILNTPVLFILRTKYSKMKKDDIENLKYFTEALKNLFISNFIIKHISKDREKRLGIPNNLKEVKLNSLILQEIINKKITIDFFNIEIRDEEDVVIERVF